MEDLIRRADAIKAEADRVYEVLHLAGCKESYEDCLKDAVKTFKDIPSAEKQGDWINLHNGKWKCSECGIEVLIYAKGNFCPNCGARMKGADDE